MTSAGPAERPDPYAYPPHWEADVIASDGGTVHLRPIVPSDAEALVAFHAGLSIRTRYLRYFSAYPTIPDRDLIRFTNVDHRDRVAFVVLLGDRIIAVGLYERTAGTDEAEVAFVVADEHQGRGIGSVLLEHLAAAGRESGLRRFSAVVLAENEPMLRVFREAGYQATRHIEFNEVALEFDIGETALTETVMREREQHAEAISIRRLLFPTSVAVVGASESDMKIGNALIRAVIDGGFTGDVYPVNVTARQVGRRKAYPSLEAVPGAVDLAVVAVPAGSVPDVVAQAGDVGAHGLVIVSGGFGESGDAQAREVGLAVQRVVVGAARAHGMRIVGPNCLGVINTDPEVRLNASLAPLTPPRGRAGFFCQSGALGVAVLGEAAKRGLGVSTFVSAGNRADVSGNDLLQYWETDPATDMALLYLESFGNPRKFARLARRMARHKPIVAVKSGRYTTVQGLRSTTVRVPETAVQALFEASGVIRVDTLGDLFDVALVLASQPLPTGDGVAVVGNSSALGVLVADACSSEGLRLVKSVDVGVDVTPEMFEAAIREAAVEPDVDAVVAVFVPPLQRTTGEEYAHALRSAATGTGTPVVTTFLGFEGVPEQLAEPGPSAPMRGSIPSYPTPERAVRALARTVRHAQWLARPAGAIPALDRLRPGDARALIEAVFIASPDGRELERHETAAVLSCYGIDVMPEWQVSSLAEARDLSVRTARPVALRMSGAVRLHLADESAMAEAWASLDLAEVLSPGVRATVQVMAPRGVDVLMDVQDDHSFGALVSFGVGGVATDLLGDRAYGVVPLTDVDAEALIKAPRAAPLLTGYADAEPADLNALSDLALRLSALADENPEIATCALWAVASPSGAHVLAASIEVVPPTARADTGPRRLAGL